MPTKSHLSVSILNLIKKYYFSSPLFYWKTLVQLAMVKNEIYIVSPLAIFFVKAKHYNFDDFPSNTIILFHITVTWIYPPSFSLISLWSSFFRLINLHFLLFPFGLELSSPSVTSFFTGFSDISNQGTILYLLCHEKRKASAFYWIVYYLSNYLNWK